MQARRNKTDIVSPSREVNHIEEEASWGRYPMFWKQASVYEKAVGGKKSVSKEANH